MQTFASGKSLIITKKIEPTDLTLLADRDIGIDKGRIFFTNGAQKEWIEFEGISPSGSNFLYSGLRRGLSQIADPSTTGTGLTWIGGTIGVLVAMHDQLIDKNEPTQFIQEALTFDTLVDRDTTLGGDGVATFAYTSVYVVETGLFYNYNLSSGQWEAIDTGTVTPNASLTVAGKVEIPTQTQVNTQVDTGETGAFLAVIPSTLANYILNIIASSVEARAGTNDTKIMTPLKTKMSVLANSIFGDGSDGSIAGALTITGSNNTVIVKNYIDFAPGVNTVTVTPTGCITIIKVQGNCDLTGSTFNFSGKGMPGGAGGLVPSGAGTASTASTFYKINTAPTGGAIGADGPGNSTGGGGGGGGTSLIFQNGNNGVAGGGPGGAAGVGGINNDYYLGLSYLWDYVNVPVFVGQGGSGGGCGGDNTSGAGEGGGNGGTGGAGGGYVVLLVGGTLTLSGTTINVSGTNGANGDPGSAVSCSGGGGGGGGAGGSFMAFYKTLSGSNTPNVSGGTGGTGGISGGGSGNAGGAGGNGQNGIFKFTKI